MISKYNKFLKEKQMRDILNLLDAIVESRGLSGRKPGAVYKRGENADDQIVFQNLTFYPTVGQYATKEETQAAFDQVQKKIGHPIEKIGQASNSNKAFGIATFDTAVGTRYLAKFAQNIKPVFDSNKFFQTDDIPGGFSQADARGSKEKVGYKPTQVLTEFKSQTPDSILGQIQTAFGADSDEYRAAVIIASASSFPVSVPSGKMDFAGFRDYFCEMLQPIVLINGQPVKGNAAKAAEVFMDGTYSDCVVSFNNKPIGELYDSLLINPSGKQIKLSSKGAKGADASSTNLIKAVREMEAAGIMTPFRELYPEAIQILEEIDQGNHNSTPLALAEQFGIITAAEASQVMTLESYAGDKNFNIDNTKLTKNLKKIYKDRVADDENKVIPLNHLVASIAYKVCNEINLKTNFSEAAADILNNSAFVQMYTEAKKGKGEFIIQGFNTIWPSKLFTQVTLEATKSYSSTASSSGKLVFNINKVPKAEPNVEKSATTDAPGPSQAGELVDYIPPRPNLKASAGGVVKDEKFSKESLGRDYQR
jgi:hypothetical protein